MQESAARAAYPFVKLEIHRVGESDSLPAEEMESTSCGRPMATPTEMAVNRMDIPKQKHPRMPSGVFLKGDYFA